MDRNNFIGGKATRRFLVSSLISTMSLQLPIMVIPFIAGRLLCPESLAAINLTTPIKELWYAIVLLFTMGANLLAGYCIGNNKKEDSCGHFTASIISCVIAILALFGIIFPLRHFVTDFICGDNPQIWQLTYDYLSISLFDCLPMAVFESLGLFISMDGHPEKVAKISSVASVLEIVLALCMAGFFQMGIKGLAWAVVIGDSIGAILSIPYFFSDDTSLKFHDVKDKMFYYLSANLKKGLPQMLDNIFYMLSILIINSVSVRIFNEKEVVAWSIILTISTFGDFFYCAISQTEMSLGEVYIGERDINGVKFLIKNSRRILLLCLIVLFSAIEISPSSVMRLFGIEDPILISECGTLMRMAAFFIFYHFVVLVSGEFCLMGRDRLYTLFLLVANIIPVIISSLFAFLTPRIFWWNYFVCSIAYMAHFLWMDKKSRGILIEEQNAIDLFEVSMPYDMSLIGPELNKIRKFLLSQHVPDDTVNRIEHCTDELSYNIIKHRQKSLEGKTFDIRVVICEGGQIDLIFKDAGRPFNPIINFDTDAASAIQNGEKAQLSLRVFNYFASNPEYRRLHSINFTRMTFPSN